MSANLKTELQRVKKIIIMLAEIVDPEYVEKIAQENFETLEIKLFTEITYFLMKSIPGEWTNGMPKIASKNIQLSHIFIKQLFDNIDKLKNENSWFHFPNYQRSHFKAPRPENPRVIEFLSLLSQLAIYLVTDTRPGDDFEAEKKKLLEERSNLFKLKEELKEKIKAKQEKRREVAKTLEGLVEQGILKRQEDYIVQDLLKAKTELEKELLDKVNKLSTQLKELY